MITMNETNSLEWLAIPEIDIINGPVHLLYGADRIVAKYCETKLVPTGIRGEWLHGCTFPWFRESAALLIGGNIYNKDNWNWVVRKDEQEVLEQMGFKAKAIGLPICYLEVREYKRRENSILIMPAHSSHFINAYSSEKDSPATAYSEYLATQLSRFDIKAASLHSECIFRGLWIKELKALNVCILQGAGTNDANSTERIRALMSQFEFVTSNVLGSHIFYAAAFGAKVSIAGPYQKWVRKEFLKEPFYNDHPELLDYLEEEEELSRHHFPFLFVDPQKAKQQIDWGMEMIGMNNKISASDLTRILRIDHLSELERRVNRYSRKIARKSLQLLGVKRASKQY